MKERQIEDYLCENPDSLCMSKIIDRQIVLPHGILDVLAVSGYQVFVIELKSVKLQEKDIGQVLRYKFDVGRFLLAAGLYQYRGWLEDGLSSQSLTDIAMRREWRLSIGHEAPNNNEQPRLVPYLVGKSVDDKVLCAAEAAGIEVYTWTHHGDGTFSFHSEFFDQAWDEQAPYPRTPPFPAWVDETVLHLAKACCWKALRQFDDFCMTLCGIDVVEHD